MPLTNIQPQATACYSNSLPQDVGNVKKLVETMDLVDEEEFIKYTKEIKPSVRDLDTKLDFPCENWKIKHPQDGHTLLSYAVSTEKYEVANHLIHMGVDLRTIDNESNSVLMNLIFHYNENEEVNEQKRETFLGLAERLIALEDDINRANNKKETAPMLALSSASNFDEDVLLKLLTLMEEKGIEMKSKDYAGHTLMSKAIGYTKGTRVLEKIIELGADVNDYAAIGDEVDVRGLYSRWQGSRGTYRFAYTPLHLAILGDDLGKVKLLVEKGCNKDDLSTWGVSHMGSRCEISALSLAEKRAQSCGISKIAEFLIKSEFDYRFSDSRSYDSDDDLSVVSSDIDYLGYSSRWSDSDYDNLSEDDNLSKMAEGL